MIIFLSGTYQLGSATLPSKSQRFKIEQERDKIQQHTGSALSQANQKYRRTYPLALSLGDFHGQYAASPKITLR